MPLRSHASRIVDTSERQAHTDLARVNRELKQLRLQLAALEERMAVGGSGAGLMMVS
jgi:hypothetical protein